MVQCTKLTKKSDATLLLCSRFKKVSFFRKVGN